jgi:hypothetical protein
MPQKRLSSPRPVKVTLDVTLPSSRFGPHRVVLEDPSGRSVTVADVSVEMVDGKPEFITLHIAPGSDVSARSSPTVSPAALATVDWHKAAWDAVLIEAGGQVFLDETLTPNEMVERLREVEQTADESRRYNRLTGDQLAEVLELWNEGGSQAVATRFCVSRRQADRYVKKARQKAGTQ